MGRLKRLERFQPFKTFKDERGVALVVVMWIFIFLLVVAFDFSAAVREEGVAAHRYGEETEGYYLALAGFQATLYRILQGPASEEETPPAGAGALVTQVVDGNWHEETFGAGSYRVRAIDEGGKVNLNRADENMLRGIFTHLGAEQVQTDVLVDSILDWRDEDDLHRINGAESDYYLSLSPPYTARNGPFDTVEDLLWVRGMTPKLFYGQTAESDGNLHTVGITEVFTVDSPMDRVNLRTASAEVIHAIVGLPLEKSKAFVEQRGELSEKTLGDLLGLLGIAAGDVMLRQFVFVNPSVITIEAVGRHGESLMQGRLKGVIRVAGGNRSFQLIRWVDRDTGSSRWTEG